MQTLKDIQRTKPEKSALLAALRGLEGDSWAPVSLLAHAVQRSAAR